MNTATKATLTFFERESWPSDERPYELLFQPPDSDFPVSNYRVIQVPNVPIHDLRPLKSTLSLDRQGFLIAAIDTKMEYEDYFDQEKLKSTYMPEIKKVLKESLGIRSAYVHECVSDGKASHSGSFGQPIPNIHTDYTHNYALELIEQLTGDKKVAEKIKESRVQMLKSVASTSSPCPLVLFLSMDLQLTKDSIWKPLRGPLRSWPLTLCDLQSLNHEDIMTFDEVHATAVLQSQQVMYNPAQKWYYLPNQEPNELIIFKSMDTEVRGEVAHGSFFDPKCPQDEPSRESIELRVLVVY